MVGVKEQPPAISDISNADSLVRVQSSWFSKRGQIAFPSLDKVQLEGERGCSQFGKPAIMLSGRCVFRSEAGVCWTREYLFACRTPEGEEMADEKETRTGSKLLPARQEESSAKPVIVEPERGESDAYMACIADVSGRVPAEWCDRFR